MTEIEEEEEEDDEAEKAEKAKKKKFPFHSRLISCFPGEEVYFLF